jgi:hypothetical protein
MAAFEHRQQQATLRVRRQRSDGPAHGRLGRFRWGNGLRHCHGVQTRPIRGAFPFSAPTVTVGEIGS